MTKLDSVYHFTLPEPTKVQKQGDKHPVLKFNCFAENEKFCICRTSDKYIGATESLREEEKNLLITTIHPHRKVATSTVSGWLKKTIHSSGIDTEKFQGHSTRSAATSKASLNGASIEDIMKAAHWSKESTFHKIYNNSQFIKDSSFQGAVFQSFKHRSLKL